MNEIQRIPDQLQVRCPECFKSYNIAVDELSEPQPRFECSGCRTIFWLDRRQALENFKHLIGLPMSLFPELSDESSDKNKSSIQTKAPRSLDLGIFNCPKCNTSYKDGDTECSKCGVIFLKFSEIQDKKNQSRTETYASAPELRRLWEDVLANYENTGLHQIFVNAAQAGVNLEYAAAKYKSILEVAPHDEIAAKFQKEIEALANINFEMTVQYDEMKPRQWLDQISFFKGLEVTFRKFKWADLIFVACGFLIVMGIFLPHLRNLVGLGSSILFFMLALRYYFRVI